MRMNEADAISDVDDDDDDVEEDVANECEKSNSKDEETRKRKKRKKNVKRTTCIAISYDSIMMLFCLSLDATITFNGNQTDWAEPKTVEQMEKLFVCR